MWDGSEIGPQTKTLWSVSTASKNEDVHIGQYM